MLVIILTREGLVHEEPSVHAANEAFRCYAEVSADALEQQHYLLDRIVQYAFDRLRVNRLEVRVLDADSIGSCGPSAH